MKFLKAILVLLVIFGLFTWMVDSYLSPDDLAKCDTQPTAVQGCQSADAIVAVSGGDTAARADEAIKLYKSGWGRMIIFSGAAADKSGPSNALVMKARAIDADVDPNDILIEESSETTAENAYETISIFETYRVQSAILVTSAYHQRRASLEFERRAGSVDLRRHPVAQDKHWGMWWWLTPHGWALAMPEFVRSLILSTGGVDQR